MNERPPLTNKTAVIRRAVDVAMTAVIVTMLSFAVTGQLLHEWMGITMTALVICHILLNRAWYGHLFKGRYRGLRIYQTALNLALLVCFALTALSGMLMSDYAVPFLRVRGLTRQARELHLAFSHWSYVLVSAHLGFHWDIMTQRLRRKRTLWRWLSLAGFASAACGCYLSVKNQIFSYMFFRMQFAFFDYSSAPVRVIAENLLILSTWVLISFEVSRLLRRPAAGRGGRKNR